jgi:hypothetical protein
MGRTTVAIGIRHMSDPRQFFSKTGLGLVIEIGAGHVD